MNAHKVSINVTIFFVKMSVQITTTVREIETHWLLSFSLSQPNCNIKVSETDFL